MGKVLTMDPPLVAEQMLLLGVELVQQQQRRSLTVAAAGRMGKMQQQLGRMVVVGIHTRA
jgi:hypothetical protein